MFFHVKPNPSNGEIRNRECFAWRPIEIGYWDELKKHWRIDGYCWLEKVIITEECMHNNMLGIIEWKTLRARRANKNLSA